ncbi:hypothetical protein OC834_006625 [Tilletia horrida]|nr:hypothetical protein OC834_006625 [Tilletia horrida]KAK0565667.1 hypothetical protein OC844_001105 [Tilletia horrida]
MTHQRSASCASKPLIGKQIWYDRGTLARIFCPVGVLCSLLISIAAIGAGVYLYQQPSHQYRLSKTDHIVFTAVLNMITTICNESMGYIHSISLRWSLFDEGKLQFNSNLRMFTSSKQTAANSRFANLVCFIGVILSYSSGALLLVAQGESAYAGVASDPTAHIAIPQAFITYGIGILLQVIVTVMAIPSAYRAPTFSCSPLDTAAAALTRGQGQKALHRQEGRCMMGVDRSTQPSEPTKPSERQKSLFLAHKQVRPWLYVSFAAAAGGLIIAGVLLALIIGGIDGSGQGTLNIQRRAVPVEEQAKFLHRAILDSRGLHRRWEAAPGSDMFTPWVFGWLFAVISAAQTPLTMVLHSGERVVNCRRDESAWRKMARAKGLPRKAPSPPVAFICSLSAMSLFFFKAAIHWVYSNAMTIVFVDLLTVSPYWVFGVGGGCGLLTAFLMLLTLVSCRGPQPATYGHLQTLIDLIDEWPTDEQTTMYWGHKERCIAWKDDMSINHAGVLLTGPPSEDIQMDQLYS